MIKIAVNLVQDKGEAGSIDLPLPLSLSLSLHFSYRVHVGMWSTGTQRSDASLLDLVELSRDAKTKLLGG